MFWMTAVALFLGPVEQPTFQQASELPEREVMEMALGPLAPMFVEMQRPYFGGLPPVTSYSISFAGAPRQIYFDGLCESQILRLTYWSREPINENLWDHPVILKYWRSGRMFAYTPFHETGDGLSCDGRGPIFSDPNRDFLPAEQRTAVKPGSYFFYVEGTGDQSNNAAFGVRAIEKARAKCGPALEACVDEDALTVPILFDQLWSIEVGHCKKPDNKFLCITARFLGERDQVPGSAPYQLIEIWTDAEQSNSVEFSVSEVTQVAGTILSH